MKANWVTTVILIVTLLTVSTPEGISAGPVLGEVIVNGIATLNHVKVTSGRTIYSSCELETHPSGTAIVNLHKGKGVLAIEPNSRVNLKGTLDGLIARVSRGSVTFRVRSAASVVTPQIEIQSDSGSVYQIAVGNGRTEVHVLEHAVKVISDSKPVVVPSGSRFDSWAPAGSQVGGFGQSRIMLSEIDADQGPVDNLEFIELFDGGYGDTPLDGFVVVLYEGKTRTVYAAFDLAGHVTNPDGYFVLGNPGVAHVGLTFPQDTLKDGPAAVALYQGTASAFPPGTALVMSNLVDAVVYSTGTSRDAGLMTLINPDQPHVNENAAEQCTIHSNQRCNLFSCRMRDTDGYVQAKPTPGASNDCPPSAARLEQPRRRSKLLAFLWPLIAGGVALPVALAVAGGEGSPPVSPTTPRR